MYSGKLRENAHPEEAPWSDGFLPVKNGGKDLISSKYEGY